MHRYVEASTIHPLTGQIVGEFYRADQQPFDHDNDGIEDYTDDDDDGDGILDELEQ